MRKFNLLSAFIALITLVSVQAQTSKDKWLIGVGMHAVDYTSVRGVGDGFFDYDDYSIVPPLSKLTVARSLTNNIALDFEASFGEVDDKRLDINDEFYALVGLGLRYYLANGDSGFLGKTFNPYVRVGANYHRYDYTQRSFPYYGTNGEADGEFVGLEQPTEPQENNFAVTGGAGFNLWFTKNFGLNVESNYVWVPAFEQDYFNHFQHSVGVVFKFGNTDQDGDGIEDKDDTCPEVAGPAENNGCPWEDTDGDGFMDNVDECVTDPNPENNGCPWPDTDGDGILDKDDACPKVAGLAKFQGCPDTDGDGIQDSKDKCPTVYGPANNNGCPKTDAEKATELTGLLDGLIFNTNSDVIRADQEVKITNAVQYLKENDGNFNVDGHTDTRGSATYNKNLSTKRAKAVVAALVAKGVAADRLEARGFGEEQPKFDESTPEGLEKNRRVVFSTK